MNRMIGWFAQNPVAANLLMIFLVVGGLIAAFNVRAEVFPEIALDRIVVEVPYLGAAPEEVEEAVCVRIEESIQGIDGIKEIVSTASEGVGTVTIELDFGADARRVLDDVKGQIDAIDTFPEETEKPIIRELIARDPVIDVAVSGRADEYALKTAAERVRDDLSALPEISHVEMVSARPYEISIEVSESALRRHGLTFDAVAGAVRRSSLDLPGGSVRSGRGEILLRTIGQAYRGDEYERLVLLTRADGTRLLLGEVATVVDGFAETDQYSWFDGEPAILISVFRTGEQNALDIAAGVHDYVARARPALPEGISLTVWQDQALMLSTRLETMLRTGLAGFALVFLVLTLFLELRLAFWVSLGIPISFMGAVMLMPGLGATVNVLSLFAFILVLGIVVDDAIIVGENIYAQREKRRNGLDAATEGAREIATPVVFAVLTTVAAFMPLMFVPGMMGKFFRIIPLVVVPSLLFSLVESLNILPAHLSRLPQRTRRGPVRRVQRLFADGLIWFARNVYARVLGVALRWRYLTAAVGVSTLVLTGGMVLGGWTSFHFFPSIEADFMAGSVTLPQGAPVSATAEAVRQLEAGAERLRRELREETGDDYFRHVLAAVGEQPTAARESGPPGTGGTLAAPHLGEVTIELLPAEERVFTSEQIAARWRELTGPIPEAVDLAFTASLMEAGEDIDVMLVGPDIDRLRAAAEDVKAELAGYTGVYGIADSFRAGKREMKLGIKPAAETLGLTLQDLGRQVRQAFYGEEAQRVQRGRDDVRVMVRYPADQRRSLGNLESMRIRTPDGGEAPFRQVAEVDPGRGFASIKRVDRNRAVNVTAAVDEALTTSGAVIGDLEARILPDVLARRPGVRYVFEGVQAEADEATAGLQTGFAVALLVIFALLAIPLKSYLQPLIIMSAIPFGLVGAVWGHVIMDMHVSLMSMFGLVALAGVVVNDSLVLVTFINRKREAHADLAAAVREAGIARFRPILLTSLTTFFGLAPLMVERSFDAAFLQPMAVSLAFGVIFATFITLVLVPTSYLITEDLRRLARLATFRRDEPPAGGTPPYVSTRVALP